MSHPWIACNRLKLKRKEKSCWANLAGAKLELKGAANKMARFDDIRLVLERGKKLHRQNVALLRILGKRSFQLSTQFGCLQG
jgi:hypothetical protein